jgi:hypothetical protein
MNPCTGILVAISLTCFEFGSSLLGQDEKLNFYLFIDNLHSGLDKNPRGNLKYD